MKPPHLAILGGGPCGLYAAHAVLSRGAGVTLFEKERHFGGLASGREIEGNWYDLGVHMLHAFDEEIFATCRDVMGPERIEVPLKSHIRWNGRLYHYPLRGRDILAGIPPLTLIRCLAGLFIAELESRFGSPPSAIHAEHALIGLYGEPLYRYFFEDFTHRYWGIHPCHLSAEFIRQKMPRLSAVDVFKNLLEKLHLAAPRDSTDGALRFETLHYSATGAETLPRTLAVSLAARGADLHLEAPVTRITHDGQRVTGIVVGGESHAAFDAVVSTIPLPELVAAMDPAAPSVVRRAASRLRYRPMTVYALLVRKERCMDVLYTYYRDRIFHRVGEPKNAGLRVRPDGHTVLIVETTCETGDAKWSGEALPRVLEDLRCEGLCEPDELVTHHLIHVPHAYPVFSLGFEQDLAVVRKFLLRFGNLRTTGRQGGFTYPNMHAAMRMGADAVAELL